MAERLIATRKAYSVAVEIPDSWKTKDLRAVIKMIREVIAERIKKVAR